MQQKISLKYIAKLNNFIVQLMKNFLLHPLCRFVSQLQIHTTNELL